MVCHTYSREAFSHIHLETSSAGGGMDYRAAQLLRSRGIDVGRLVARHPAAARYPYARVAASVRCLECRPFSRVSIVNIKFPLALIPSICLA